MQISGTNELKNETSVLHGLRHPGVVKMSGTFAESNSLCLVLGYALNGDLSSFLARNRKLYLN